MFQKNSVGRHIYSILIELAILYSLYSLVKILTSHLPVELVLFNIIPLFALSAVFSNVNVEGRKTKSVFLSEYIFLWK